MKRVLHIATDYSGTPLYRELLTEQLALGLKLYMYIPERNPENIGRYWLEEGDVRYSQPLVIKPYDKFLYFTKIARAFRALEQECDLSEIGLTHAHTLFTDGGIAYRLWKKHGIPYVVAVRNTDINAFFKYAVHLRSLGLKILANASRIVFLSPVYREFCLSRYVSKLRNPQAREAIKDKSVVIFNGIANEWHADTPAPRSTPATPLRVGYAARRFTAGKNPFVAVQAVQKLNALGIPAEIHMAGSGDASEKLKTEPSVILHGPLTSIAQMKQLYDAIDVFLLPSLAETFGLVYAEALSRGVPAIYTKGQGFDGQFPEGEIGYAVSGTDVSEIVEKIKLCMDDYSERSVRCLAGAQRFRWSAVARRYDEMYREVALLSDAN